VTQNKTAPEEQEVSTEVQKTAEERALEYKESSLNVYKGFVE
jgi:hypothetical protein